MGWWSRFKQRDSQKVWFDPERRILTLESFANTEEDGGRDLVAAARRISDPELREHIERHAADETRHAALFRHRAAELRAEGTKTAADVPDKPYDLSHARPGLEVDSHGFFNAGLCDELGELEYVAMLHVAEQRAEALFDVFSRQTKHDPKTQAVFQSILKDEKYHVAYTGKFLERWRNDGRDREVDKALKSARSSRFMGAWKRVGLRAASGFSKVLMLVVYWTVLLPFACIARAQPWPRGWHSRRGEESVSPLNGQY